MIKKNFVLGAMLCASVSLWALSASAFAPTYKYDANGRLVEVNSSHCGDCGAYYSESYTYDANGNMISSFIYEGAVSVSNNSTPSSKSEYIYDANGNQTQQLSYSCSGGTCNNTLSSKSEYTYDANGNQTSHLYYGNATSIANNTPTSKNEYTYDSNGNQTSRLEYNSANAIANNTPTSKYEYTYDANGNQTSKIRYSCSGGTCNDTPSNTYTYTYDFDDYGNVVNKYQNGSLQESYQYADAAAYAALHSQTPTSCENGYALIDGACVEVKTRFTIQEAEALTTNDNNNWVEWTFE